MASAESIKAAMDFSATYQWARGAAFRRETFGGIVYHYEGLRPDPRMVFVPSPFLSGLLERMDQGSLRDLIDAATEKFSLNQEQVRAVESFFAELLQQGTIQGAGC